MGGRHFQLPPGSTKLVAQIREGLAEAGILHMLVVHKCHVEGISLVLVHATSSMIENAAFHTVDNASVSTAILSTVTHNM